MKISAALVPVIRQHVTDWGGRERETGLFLLGERGSEVVDVAAWPLREGVVRKRGQFSVSGGALSHLFEFAAERELQIVSLLHSHSREAFLSPVDLKYGFAVKDFLSDLVEPRPLTNRD